MPRKNRYKPRKDGRFFTQVCTGEYDDSGRPIRIPLYASSSKELEQKVDELKANIKTGKFVIKKKYTLETYATKFVEVYKSTREYNTQKTYEDMLRLYIFPALGNLELPDIKRTDIQAIINEHSDHPRTCELIKIVLKQILDSAVADHLIIENPWFRITMPKYTPPKRRILTPLEEQALNTAAFNPEEHLLVMLLFGCGLRLGELLALHADDIDLQSEEVIVRHALIFKNNRAELKDAPKTANGFRKIPIPEFLVDEVRFYVLRIRKQGGTYLFTYSGEPYSKSHFYDAWEVIVRKMNAAVATDDVPEPITGLTSRVFRYNYATILYYSGITLKKAVDLMGHADEKMILKVYAQLDEERENAKKKLSGIRPGMVRTAI